MSVRESVFLPLFGWESTEKEVERVCVPPSSLPLFCGWMGGGDTQMGEGERESVCVCVCSLSLLCWKTNRKDYRESLDFDDQG